MASTQATDRLVSALQRWADGKATLKDVRGYSNDELYALARMAHIFFHQGKVQEARTIFQGLFAVNPRDAYFARALAVVEYASGNADGALSAYDIAVRLDPDEAAGYIGRAEVLLALERLDDALEDLRRTVAAEKGDERLKKRAFALLTALQAS